MREFGNAPVDRYAGNCMNQHSEGWCGMCYMSSAVQCFEDRAHLATARYAGEKIPRLRMDIQMVLDYFKDSTAPKGWNACHGGFPMHVLKCIKDGVCPIKWEYDKGDRNLLGYSRGKVGQAKRRAERRPAPRIVSVRHIPHADVEREIMERGPVVLEVSGDVIESADPETGICTELHHTEVDHAVCVVGWETRHGVRCWIVRNVWGKQGHPSEPKSFKCVKVGQNECKVPWKKWTGDPTDPGFCLLPCSFAALKASPSPWIAPRVEITCSGCKPESRSSA